MALNYYPVFGNLWNEWICKCHLLIASSKSAVNSFGVKWRWLSRNLYAYNYFSGAIRLKKKNQFIINPSSDTSVPLTHRLQQIKNNLKTNNWKPKEDLGSDRLLFFYLFKCCIDVFFSVLFFYSLQFNFVLMVSVWAWEKAMAADHQHHFPGTFWFLEKGDSVLVTRRYSSPPCRSFSVFLQTQDGVAFITLDTWDR